jgi:glutathione S-transferase
MKADMKLYWHPFSIIPWRVRIALREKHIACEEVTVDIYSSQQPGSEIRRLNPFGQIPVLEVGELRISESLAILEYLEETHPVPALLPRGAVERATVRQFMCWSTDYWPPAWKKWIAPRLANAAWTQESVQEGRKEISAHLDVLEAQLTGRDWIVDTYSLADICYAPLVLVLDRVGLAEEVAGRQAVARWVDGLRARPAVRETMMPIPGAERS